MNTDFNIVGKQVVRACNALMMTSPKEVTAYINFFRTYYEKYERRFQRQHRHLKTESIEDCIYRLIEAMAELDMSIYDNEYLAAMMDKYFETQFDDCDYSICHFCNLEILRNRYYELFY